MNIEKVATNTVELAISKTEYLDSFVNDGDKEPSWDGNIYAYSNPSKNKGQLIGRVPVQVKGKLDNDFSKKNISYAVDVSDLNNYLIDGGTIFFVVYLNQECNGKIYYSCLLPYELNKLLLGIGKQKRRTIGLKELPNDKNEVANIVINFINDKKKQAILRNGKNISIEDIVKNLGKDNLSFSFGYTGLGYDKNKPYEYLFTHDIYLYAENEELNVKIPIDHIKNIDWASSSVNASVCIENKVYYNKYRVVHKVDEDELHIGKSLIFTLREDGYKFNYKLSGNLQERIQDQELVLDMLDKKVITINKVDLPINPTDGEIKGFNIKNSKKLLEFLKTVQEVLNILGIYDSLDFNNLFGKDDDYLKMLIRAFIHGESVGFEDDPDIPPIAKITLSNLNILLIFEKTKNNKYILKNFFNEKVLCQSKNIYDEMFETSQFTVLTENNFCELSNINYKYLLQSIFSIENSGHYSSVNYLLLEMLKAYDKCNKKEILESATDIAKWLNEREESKEMTILNLYQCYLRTRELQDNEIDQLLQFTQNENQDLMIMVGTYLLLGNERSAERSFRKLTDEKQEEFKLFPIYHFWKK